MVKKRILILILGLLIFGNGCYSLRKKFIRAKEEKETPVYVDFKDYPEVDTKKLYNEYYTYINAWLEELIESLGEEVDVYNYKRDKRAIEEIIKNLDLLLSLFTEEGQAQLKPLYTEILTFRDKFTPFITDSEKAYILQRLQLIKIRFDDKFSYSKVSLWIK